MFLEKHSAFPHDLSLKNISDKSKTSLSSGEEEGNNISILGQDLTFTKYTPVTSPGETIENAFLSKVSQNCVNEQVSNHPTVTDDILEYPWRGPTYASKYVSSIVIQSV